MLLLTKIHTFFQISLVFTQCPFSSSRSPSRILLVLSCLLRLLWSVTVSQTFLVTDNRERRLVRCLSNGIHRSFFSWLDWGWTLGDEDPRGPVPSPSHYTRSAGHAMTYPCQCWSSSRGFGFSICPSQVSPLFLFSH